LEPVLPLEQSDRFQCLLRRVLHEDGGRAGRDPRGVALVAAEPGAGTTFIARSLVAHVNNAAVQGEISRMAKAIDEIAGSLPVYAGASRIVASIENVISQTTLWPAPSRMAIAVDYRQVCRPGAGFGAVVADGLEPQLLHSRTSEGQSVQSILDGMSSEWDNMTSCRKECLRILGSTFRLVLLDLPSLKESAEIRTVAPIVDGVVVVVEADKTTTRDLARLTEAIESAGGRILGHVLNKRRYPIPGFLYKHLERAGLT
jgi:hypothetical protein